MPVADTFSSLLEFQWRSIGIPTSEMSVEVRRDLVIHKFADRDGAHVEDTGRHPLQFTARIPFLNGISPGPNESWGSTPLYPTLWRAFFAACTDTSKSGILQHPELGTFNCKLEHCKTVWSAARRGGVDVEASWIESDDTGDDLSIALSKPSPLAGLVMSAAAIDAQIALITADSDAGLSVYVPNAPVSSYVTAITTANDTDDVLSQNSGGQCAVIIAQSQAIQASIGSSPLTWQLNLACDQAIESARNTQATLLTQGQGVSLYTVTKDSTMGQLASVIPADIESLIRLNPLLVQSPIVRQGTVVRFFALQSTAA